MAWLVGRGVDKARLVPAGFGALLTLYWFHAELNVYSFVGLMMLVPPLLLMMAGPRCGRYADKVGYDRISWLGSAVLLLAAVSQGVSGSVAVGLVGIGLGRALFQAANNTAVMTNIRPDQRGVISGILSLSRNLGLITGASAMGTVFALASATI